jgi:hypothetical protein
VVLTGDPVRDSGEEVTSTVKRFFLRLLYSSTVLAALIFLLGAPRKWGT